MAYLFVLHFLRKNINLRQFLTITYTFFTVPHRGYTTTKAKGYVATNELATTDISSLTLITTGLCDDVLLFTSSSFYQFMTLYHLLMLCSTNCDMIGDYE
jgi:hypothetical protein